MELQAKKKDAENLVYGKLPPQNIDLEKAVLGAIMVEKGAFDKVSDILTPSCFYLDAHQKIFKSMSALAVKRLPIDLLTIVEQLRTENVLEEVGGPYAVSKLTNSVISSANIEAHSRIVMQKFLSRELIRLGGEMVNNAFTDTADIFDMMDQAEENISKLRMGNLKQQYTTLQSVVKQNLIKLEVLRHRDEAITGVPSGFHNLDMVTSGWQNSNLIILAARPSVGKTAFALTLAKNAAKEFHIKYLDERKKDPTVKQKSVGFFSLEMKDNELVNRVLAAESDVWLWRFKNGKLDEQAMKQIYSSAERLETCKILIDDTGGIPVPDFKSKARQMKRKENVGIIFVDYLQLMTAPGIASREQQISYISRELKGMAKELDIPIIALSQLNRDIEKTGSTGKREPNLSDIRESGAIEQDADIVMFLYKPSESEIAADAALADTFFNKIAKHRSGALAKFIGKFTGIDQKHHYLNVVDGNTLVEIGPKWTPVNSLPPPRPPAPNHYEPEDKEEDPPF